MSSLLNVSNNSSKSEGFSLKDIEVLVDSKKQPWFKRADIGKFLGIAHIITSTTNLTEEDMKSQAFLQLEDGVCSTDSSWEDAQDMFVSLTGALYITVNPRKDKVKALKEHILKEIVPRGFDARIEEIQEKHNQQATQLQQAITYRENQIQTILYENVALQGQRDVHHAQLQRCQDQIHDLIINRHVPHANDPGKDY